MKLRAFRVSLGLNMEAFREWLIARSPEGCLGYVPSVRILWSIEASGCRRLGPAFVIVNASEGKVSYSELIPEYTGSIDGNAGESFQQAQSVGA